MRTLKTLIHVHTDYSFDCDVSLETLAWSVANERIGCIAITDHNTIDGALRFRGMTDARVIVGEEISTTQGHLIGLFLKSRVAPGLSVRDAALAIRAQGGLVLAPHPFVRLAGCGLRRAAWDIIDLIDAVEIQNAQNVLPHPDWQACRFVEETGRIGYVGADTHRVGTLAPCYQVLRDFAGPADFLDALASAELCMGYHSLRYRAAMALQAVRSLAGVPLPDSFGANARPDFSAGTREPFPDVASV
jgi:hypothetical protein